MISIPDSIQPKAFLSATAKHELARITQLMKDRGLYDELRLAAIESYCIAYGRFIDTEKELTTTKDPEAMDRLLGISASAARQMRYFGLALGLWGVPLPRAAKVADDEPEPDPDRPLNPDELNAELNRELSALTAQPLPRKRRKLQ